MADGTLERPADAPNQGAFWWGEFSQERKAFDSWRKEAQRIVEFYRGDSEETKPPEFNILWANISSLQPTILSRVPQPDVSRRFLGDGPVYRVAAEILQKSLQAQNDLYNFARELRRVRDDRLLVGRGVGRIIYERVEEQFPDGETQIAMQFVKLRYVYWEDFTHGPARCWDEVPWIRYRHYMTRDQVERKFGSGIADKITYSPAKAADEDVPGSSLNKAEIFEVWARSEYIEPSDKDMEIGPDTGEVIWLAMRKHEHGGGRDQMAPLQVLKREKPEVNFRGFFDCPEPLFATMTTDTMVPVPDAAIYKPLLEELNDVTYRLRSLISMARIKGLADGSLAELAEVMEAQDGEFIPAQNAMQVLRDTGFDKAIWVWPLDMVVGAIQVLTDRQERIKSMIYEVTGVSDIIRGATDPNETASAQQLKSNFAQLRMTPRQMPMQEFVARVFEMQAEVIAELFESDVLQQMVDLQGNDPQELQQALQLLSQDALRRFRIDVETDTMVAPDEAQLKQDAVEFLKVVGPIIAGISEVPPAIKPLAFEILKGASRTFKLGRAVEEQIDDLAQQATNPQPDQQQLPQSEAEIEQQGKIQQEQIKAQVDLQEAQIKAQVDLQIAELKAQTELRVKEFEARLDAQLERMKLDTQAALQREQGERQAELTERGQDVTAKTQEKTAKVTAAAKSKP